jgi:hypothetical protein
MSELHPQASIDQTTARIELVPPTLLIDTCTMWIAVCSNKQCQWDCLASNRISAEMYANIHVFAHGFHHVFVVEVPAESQESQDNAADAA